MPRNSRILGAAEIAASAYFDGSKTAIPYLFVGDRRCQSARNACRNRGSHDWSVCSDRWRRRRLTSAPCARPAEAPARNSPGWRPSGCQHSCFACTVRLQKPYPKTPWYWAPGVLRVVDVLPKEAELHGMGSEDFGQVRTGAWDSLFGVEVRVIVVSDIADIRNRAAPTGERSAHSGCRRRPSAGSSSGCGEPCWESAGAPGISMWV